MNIEFPVYTTPNECQDCYKCVRNCQCKAIKIVNARAQVMPELCVSCGQCVRVCPAQAKKIRSDLLRAKNLIAGGARVYASVAPSWVGYFKGHTLGQLSTALLRLGFAGVSETALGAQLVSAATAEYLRTAPPGISISSACPAAVDFIRMYYPQWVSRITPVTSPVLAHCRQLHQEFGSDMKVVFIGPCAAKKNESDRNPEDLALAITFQALNDWLTAENISLDAIPADTPPAVVPEAAQEGRAYSLEGGMNDTIREAGGDIRYVAVSGLPSLRRMLEKCAPEVWNGTGQRVFVEALACEGGCVNGPAMHRHHDNGGVDVVLETLCQSAPRTSIGREVPCDIAMEYTPAQVVTVEPSEEQYQEALAKVGKFGPSDELNCGGCGYNSCREFARAMLEGKAESAMCVSYLKKISQKTSNALIRYIPVGVVIADAQLQVMECNRHFAELCGDDALDMYDNLGSLNGAYLDRLVEYSELFENVLENGGEVERFGQLYGGKIYNISVFQITPGQSVGAVIQDVTKSELRREQVAERAREVIRENVMTVQRIASALGEHMARTEILLDEVAGIYSAPTQEEGGNVPPRLDGGKAQPENRG